MKHGLGFRVQGSGLGVRAAESVSPCGSHLQFTPEALLEFLKALLRLLELLVAAVEEISWGADLAPDSGQIFVGFNQSYYRDTSGVRV